MSRHSETMACRETLSFYNAISAEDLQGQTSPDAKNDASSLAIRVVDETGRIVIWTGFSGALSDCT
jgi:hypothetical protein